MPGNGQFKIGIDTGGTYTDAVVYCPTTETVVAKTKVPTTHGDLGVCVTNALTDALDTGAVHSDDICLISVSTTLATNALVEGGGRPAGLVAIGLEENVTARRGLDHLLPANPILRVAGGHSPHGLEIATLDLSVLPLDASAPGNAECMVPLSRRSWKNAGAQGQDFFFFFIYPFPIKSILATI